MHTAFTRRAKELALTNNERALLVEALEEAAGQISRQNMHPTYADTVAKAKKPGNRILLDDAQVDAARHAVKLYADAHGRTKDLNGLALRLAMTQGQHEDHISSTRRTSGPRFDVRDMVSDVARGRPYRPRG